MAGAVPSARKVAHPNAAQRSGGGLLVGAAVAVVVLVLVLPLAVVFVEAFAPGLEAWAAAITDPDTLSAAGLTLLAAGVAVPLNVVFGLAAAWLVARFRFPGRAWVLAAIDAPFAVSPVIAGMVFVLLFGAQGWFGPCLEANDLQIVFAAPGIVLATCFVTLPFVARELIPLLELQGVDEEAAAVTLGASGWQIFWRVTLPRLRWGLLYGVLLCNARAMGEFGAVSVVSGHVRGVTNTLPLEVEVRFNEYDTSGAFAVASLLTMLTVVTLVARKALEWKLAREARL